MRSIMPQPRPSTLLSLAVLTILAITSIQIAMGTDCSGQSDACPQNPNPRFRSNPLNYHVDTCNLKWEKCLTGSGTHQTQKPPPFQLCTTSHAPSGNVATDSYSFSVQINNFSPSPMKYTLHGLWPSSQYGRGAKDQPYGCLNGEEFDEEFLTQFGDLFNTFWPTDPQYHNTMECFVLSEWMKHGTCAVIPGADGNAFRINQEAYYRTALVLVNEYNQNSDLRTSLGSLQPEISVSCVQCAYFATLSWSDYTVASVPRISSDCVSQCFSCGSNCPAANLDSTVELNPSNAPTPTSNIQPQAVAAHQYFLKNVGMPPVEGAYQSNAVLTHYNSIEGLWRSWGAEEHGSGKFEFAQSFRDDTFVSTTDSPYPQTCNFHLDGASNHSIGGRVTLRNCGANHHSEDCLVKLLPDIGGLEVGFFACNHSGIPAPEDFYAAMDTPSCGNFLMFRCKSSSCKFSPVIQAPVVEPVKINAVYDPTIHLNQPPCVIHPYQPGIGGAPTTLLGSWRALQVSHNYSVGLGRWNFTNDGQATFDWPNYPARGVERFAVTHAIDSNKVYLTNQAGNIRSCIYEFKYNPIYSYAVLACGADNRLAPNSFEDGFNSPNTQWAMGRCNACNAHCTYSCTPENDNCGYGVCDKTNHQPVTPTPPETIRNSTTTPPKSPRSSIGNGTTQSDWSPPNWCKPGEAACWPTKSDLAALELKLGPNDNRTGLHWVSYPTPQHAPVPQGSFANQPFYGLGRNSTNGLKPMYYYENLTDLNKPCFQPVTNGDFTVYNSASDVCKAAVHQNEYRDWNPFIVVFPLNERHIRAALKFAVEHRLCISISGTGHEYLSRNSCPTGGILIRTILLKDKAFLPTWNEDPVLAPNGAFKFGAGSIFAEMHEFAGEHQRVIASGWCSTVGMVGFHLGGGHGPFAPSMGLGVDNVLEIEVLQIGQDAHGHTFIHKKIASRRHHPQLFWAMRGGGASVWGAILSMTIRAHAIPEGGFSRVLMLQNGTFCPHNTKFGYEWLRGMWQRFADWELLLDKHVSTQAAFFINDSNFEKGGLCAVTWNFKFEYFYAGGENEPTYRLFRDKLLTVLQMSPSGPGIFETNYKYAYDYLLSMPPNQFALAVSNPLPAPHPPSDVSTGSQNSVFVSRKAMATQFAPTMMDVLDICVATLNKPDPTSPAQYGHRCGFHYLYTSITGNLGSDQPDDTAISHGFRTGLMLWNARTLTTQQMEETLYRIGHNSYFSESSDVMHDWTSHYWGERIYEQLLAVKKAHDPGNHFWCHHCVGDDPLDAYGDPLRGTNATNIHHTAIQQCMDGHIDCKVTV